MQPNFLRLRTPYFGFRPYGMLAGMALAGWGATAWGQATVRLQDWVQMPASGELTAVNTNPSYVTRINLMREEPGGAGRMWLGDLNGNLYIFNKGGDYATRTAQLLAQAQANETTAAAGVYLDFNRSSLAPGTANERLNVPNNPSGNVTGTHQVLVNSGLFLNFTKQSGYANGLVCLQFDPGYPQNGKFYTIHIEMVSSSTGSSATGTRASGSNLLTGFSSVGSFQVGQYVTGTGLPAGAYITAIKTSSPTNVALSQNATSSGTSTYTFSDPHLPNTSKFPNFDAAGYSVTAPVTGGAGGSTRQAVLIEWTDTDPTNQSFEGTARELLRVAHTTSIHPMGDIIFNPLATSPSDPDYGVMYVAIGEGGSGESNSNDDQQTNSDGTPTGGDRHFNTQRLDTLQGKIIRIIPDLTLHTATSELSSNGRYRVPNDNPFTTGFAGARPEILTYGHRNPHRLSWDRVTGALLICEIGLHAWEEINIVEAGKNYGYGSREGPQRLTISTISANNQMLSAPPNPDTMPVRLGISATQGTVTPIYPLTAYPHDAGHGDAIANGFAYRGTRMPALRGKFIFGDITTGRVFYSDLAELLAAHDGNPTTLATIQDVQLQWDSPYDSPDQGVQSYARMFEIVTQAYHARGGTDGDLPGGSTISGTGRADIRLAVDAAGELYIMSKSDGLIRAVSAVPAAPVILTQPVSQTKTVGQSVTFTVLAGGSPDASYRWQRAPAGSATFTNLAESATYTGVATAALTVPNPTVAMSGDRFRCVATNSIDNTPSSPATLTVLTLKETWKRAKFTDAQLADPAISGDQADPEGDGLDNDFEYGFDLDPLANSRSLLPHPETTGNTLRLIFQAPRPELDYVVKASTNLQNWSTTGVTIATSGTQITATYTPPSGGQAFMRIFVAPKP